MAKLLSMTAIIKRIVKETGKNKEEITQLVEEKKKRFSGLLTEDGAAYMVAKELGVEVDIKTGQTETLKIKDLVPGMRNIDLIARVFHIQTPKKFESKNKKGRYCRLLVGDETGEITLTLWNDEIKKIESQKIERGAIILIKNGYISSYNEKPVISTGFKGDIVINPPDTNSTTLPDPNKSSTKLSDISEEMQNIDVFSRVLRVFEMQEFEREGKKEKLIRFEISDGKTNMVVVAWGNLAERANKLFAGEIIKIEGASVKKNQERLELHLNWNARIIEGPIIGFKIPELAEITGKKHERKKISELKKGEEKIEIAGEIIEILKGTLLFYYCRECGKKAISKQCECGKKARARLVTNAVLDDGTGNIAGVYFGRAAENVLGITTIKAEKELKEKNAEEIIEEIKKKVIGNWVKVKGKVRESSINPEEKEIIAEETTPIEKEKEIERLLKFSGNQV